VSAYLSLGGGAEVFAGIREPAGALVLHPDRLGPPLPHHQHFLRARVFGVPAAQHEAAHAHLEGRNALLSSLTEITLKPPADKPALDAGSSFTWCVAKLGTRLATPLLSQSTRVASLPSAW